MSLLARASRAPSGGQHLDETSQFLWPGARRTRSRAGNSAATGQLLLVPSGRRPRLLLPADNNRAARTVALGAGSSGAPSQRLARAVLAVAFGTGLGPLLLPDRIDTRAGGGTETVTDRLAAILGQPVSVAMAITPARANRKPVLQLLDRRGRLVGFAKVAVNELTQQLVRHEADALDRLAALRLPFQTPRLIELAQWNELSMLVMAPVAAPGSSRPDPELLRTAMQALARSAPDSDTSGNSAPGNGAAGSDAAAGSSYAQVLTDRATLLLNRLTGADRAALLQVLAVLEKLRDAAEPELGCWHGDWTPWNCGQRAGELAVWDWERFEAGVPVGFDALHYRLQEALVSGGVPHPVAARDCLRDAPHTLQGWQLTAEAARTVAALYLVTIALRYLADSQRAAGGSGGQVETWIVPALQDFDHRTR